MIIDSHAHIFPEIIAEKASKNIGDFYGIKMRHDGTRDKLLEEGKAAGVDRFLIHSVATTPKQVESINRFIADSVRLYPDRFIGFATLHPDSENLEEEFRRAMYNGLRGIKLHPDFQNFDLGSDRAKEIYKLAEGKCPVLIHMGDKRTQFSKAEHTEQTPFKGSLFLITYFHTSQEAPQESCEVSAPQFPLKVRDS